MIAPCLFRPYSGHAKISDLKEELGIGLCNITKCCTEVCPEDIHITDNAIISLKERVMDEFYDPLLMLVRKIRGTRV
jgi:succinate dehydrogenase / fumarate reductase, iron-sulfur subunit